MKNKFVLPILLIVLLYVVKVFAASSLFERVEASDGFFGSAIGLTNFPANVVVTNGSQTITGFKTLTDPLVIRGATLFDSGTNATMLIMVNAGAGIITNSALTSLFTSNVVVSGRATMQGFQMTACYVTNVFADFPNILAASFADIQYPVPATIITNMVGIISHPSTENGSLIVDCLVSNSLVTLRAKNAGGIAVDQGNLQYRIQVNTIPTTTP